MESFKIHLEDLKLYTPAEIRKRNGNVFFGIYINIGDLFFPEKNWSDIAILVLMSWVENTLSKGKTNMAYYNYFMDGPYAFKIQKKDEFICVIPGISMKGKFQKINQGVQLERNQYINELIQACKSLMSICEKMGITEEYADYNKFRKVVNDFSEKEK